MLSKVKVGCYFCRKQFLTKRAYFIFNKEAGYNSFCSQKCQYKSRLRGKTLYCGNSGCNKNFYRTPSSISTFNYCSKPCAAIINNQKYPKWPIKYCKKCFEPFRREGSPYCSAECGKLGRFKYTKNEIINTVKKYYREYSRTPAKRELPEIFHKAIHMFGSWNNTILEAGLTPHRSHDSRMYKRSKTKALDGHLCDSVSEAIIDNWLHKNDIVHARNTSYPNTNHLADWSINNAKTFIEYFGLAKDSPRYDRAIKEKMKICQKNNIKLVSIYPRHLYPKNSLDKYLSKLL